MLVSPHVAKDAQLILPLALFDSAALGDAGVYPIHVFRHVAKVAQCTLNCVIDDKLAQTIVGPNPMWIFPHVVDLAPIILLRAMIETNPIS